MPDPSYPDEIPPRQRVVIRGRPIAIVGGLTLEPVGIEYDGEAKALDRLKYLPDDTDFVPPIIVHG